jgi:putative ABC transport system permease protein
MIGDLRFASRLLGRSPGYALTCVAVLALGIGANVAIFSVVNSIILRPLPYPDPSRLRAFKSGVRIIWSGNARVQ